MKKLLIASAAMTVAAPAFAQDVTMTGTFDAEYHSKNFDGGDGDINTLTISIKYAGDGVGATATLDVASTEATAIDEYNVYADTMIGRFAIGTSDGLTTDDDIAETGSAVDFTKGVDEINDTAASIDTQDGPVENTALGVAHSATNPSLTYSAPSIGDVSVKLTMGSNAGAAQDYVLALGYRNGGVRVAVDLDENSTYVLTGVVETGVGNVAVEADNNSNYELQFATDLTSVVAPIQARLYLNSESTYAVEGRYNISEALYAGLSYTGYGDTLTSGNAGFNALMGGAAAWGVGVGTKIGDANLQLTYETIEGTAGGAANGETVVLAAEMGDVKMSYDTDAEQLYVGIATSF